MGSKTVLNGSIYRHPVAGNVKIVVRRNAVRMTATRRQGMICVTIPPTADFDRLNEFIIRAADTLPAPPVSCYSDGHRIDCDGASFVIAVEPGQGTAVRAYIGNPATRLSVGGGIDLSSPAATEAITGMLIRAAGPAAERLLLPRGREIAAGLGLNVSGWEVARGRKTLGRCSSKRVIALSAILVFFPPELRDYVICHELAHLTEMNHSPRFHALCDSYCNGREAELEAALRRFMREGLREVGLL